MKGYRVLGGLMFGLGCAIAFVGLLAFGLPLIDNNQLQLVLSSFAMPSRNLIVIAVNGTMTFALRNCYLVMAVGAALAALGAFLMLRHSPRAARQPVRSPYERAPQERRTARPPQTNHPVRPAAPTVNKVKRAVHPSVDEIPNPFARYACEPVETKKTLFSPVELSRTSAYAPPEDWIKPLIPGATDAPTTTPAASGNAPKPAEAPDQAIEPPVMAATSFAPSATSSAKPAALNEASEADASTQSNAKSEQPAEADELAAPEAPPSQPPSRIRSTMGRHS